MSDTLVFGAADFVTGQPVVNGFVLADIGVTTTESEPGYVNGGRVELGSSGLAPVVIQSVQDGSTLVIGIMCRGDTSFDDCDNVVIALRGNGNAQRRIDIEPVWGNAGPTLDASEVAQTGEGATTSVADPPDNPDFDIYTNRNPLTGPTFYQRASAADPWTAASAPAGFECKVRSWRPLVTAQSPTEIAWSVELRIPISAAGWITLGDEFGIFVDVIRCFRATFSGTPYYGSTQYKFPPSAADLPDVIDQSTDIPAASFARGLKGTMVSQGEGVRIKNGSMGIGCRFGGAVTLGNLINANTAIANPNNQIVAQLENTGAAASGIVAEVRMANWGLGAPNFFSWQLAPGCDPQSAPTGTINAGTPATPSAVVETINNWPAASVPIEYKDHKHQCMWVQLRGTSGTVVFAQSSARRNMDFTGFSEEERPAEISAVGYPKPEDGSDSHEFMLRTRCRKIVVSTLIGKDNLGDETAAIVGGAIRHGMEAGLIDRERMVGVDNQTHLSTHASAGSSAFADSVVYLWITEGLRRTHKTLIVNGIKTEVWDNGPGDFSLAAYHNGVDDPMGWQLSGPGLIKHGNGVYGIKVKDGKTATINVKVGAGPEIKPGDSSDLPRTFPEGDPGGNGGGTGPGGCGKQVLMLALIPTAIYAIGQLIA